MARVVVVYSPDDAKVRRIVVEDEVPDASSPEAGHEAVSGSGGGPERDERAPVGKPVEPHGPAGGPAREPPGDEIDRNR